MDNKIRNRAGSEAWVAFQMSQREVVSDIEEESTEEFAASPDQIRPEQTRQTGYYAIRSAHIEQNED